MSISQPSPRMDNVVNIVESEPLDICRSGVYKAPATSQYVLHHSTPSQHFIRLSKFEHLLQTVPRSRLPFLKQQTCNTALSSSLPASQPWHPRALPRCRGVAMAISLRSGTTVRCLCDQLLQAIELTTIWARRCSTTSNPSRRTTSAICILAAPASHLPMVLTRTLSTASSKFVPIMQVLRFLAPMPSVPTTRFVPIVLLRLGETSASKTTGSIFLPSLRYLLTLLPFGL